MSHYSVAVITKSNKIKEVEDLLAPFDEALEIEPYIYITKDDISRLAKQLQEKYIKMGKDDPFPTAKTDNDYYNCLKCDWAEYDEDGNELSNYNIHAKWDFYNIGGIFSYMIKHKNSNTIYNQLQIKHIDFNNFYTYAILFDDGTWYECEDNITEWRNNYKHLFDNIDSNYYLTIVDCHTERDING